jgi:hypothetical protein
MHKIRKRSRLWILLSRHADRRKCHIEIDEIRQHPQHSTRELKRDERHKATVPHKDSSAEHVRDK